MGAAELAGVGLAAVAVVALGARLGLAGWANRRGGGGDRRVADQAHQRQQSVRRLALGRGWWIADGPDAARTVFPSHLRADLVEVGVCDLLVDGRADGFRAESWSAAWRAKGAVAAYGTRQHLVRVPTGSAAVSLVISALPPLYTPLLLPALFKGRADQGEPGRVLAGGDFAQHRDRLSPLLTRIVDSGTWVIAHAGEVVVTSHEEPDADELLRRLALAHDVAAALG